VSDDDFLYDDLPEDPEMAFLSLEAHFKRECDEQLARAHQEERTDVYFIQYISRVLAAIDELGLEHKFADKSVPSIEEVNYSTYLNFSKDVEHYRTKLQIRHARRRRDYSVALDTPTKLKLRHLLSQIKETVDKLDVSQSKKEALFAKIAALESEINRDRTRFDAVAALWVEACEKVGEGLEKLEPLRKLIDSVGTLIGAAKKEEETKAHQLPAPKTPKQIAPPKEPDDDIPF
jgi:chaperonin cofactor prefoldin